MLEVNGLTTKFHVDSHIVTAVDNISFKVPDKKTVGLVGESGSGKSVTSLSVMNILPSNGFIDQGEIIWNGENILSYSKQQMKQVLGSQIGMIFQNPLAALNPVYTIGNQMVETICLHQNVSKDQAKNIAIELLEKVKIADAKKRFDDYPHQFSLGMCQRIMVALTLSMNPSLLIADEPTASLDVTIQAQILSLIDELKDDLGMSILLISHDLGVIAQHCDYILVMYLGKIIEEGTPEAIFSNPLHPYTKALIDSIPIPDPNAKTEPQILDGELPSPLNIPKGCRFHTRCPHVMDICHEQQPPVVSKSSEVACWLYEKP